MKFSCGACFDLRYNAFWSSTGLNFPEGGHVDARYRISSLEHIRFGVTQGCGLCYVIREAVKSFWPLLVSETLDLHVDKHFWEECDQVIDNYEEHDTDAGITDPRNGSGIIQNRLDSTFTHDHKRVCNLFLMLQPNKPFTLLMGHERLIWPYITSCPRVEIYTECGHPLQHPAFGHARTLPLDLNLTYCTASIQSLLQGCDKNHKACLAPSRYLPKRLVCIAEDSVRLVETSSLTYSPYLTLSHCWGSSPDMLRTTAKTLEQRKSGIDWEELPAVFKDALAITKSLGFQWIWIDSLCIMQDDEDDWKEESMKMADVYSNSSLNIAATSSPNSHQTLFAHRRHLYQSSTQDFSAIQLEVLQTSSAQSSPKVFARISHWLSHEMIIGESNEPLNGERDPLLQRAWVLQERLLAPRTIHITSSELIWECNTLLECECTGISSHSSTSSTTTGLKPRFASARQGKCSEREILDIWYLIVEEYCRLSLTKISDRPNALAGIVSCFSSILKSNYSAGIWESDAARGLLWYSSLGLSCDTLATQPGPSWSWMSRYDIRTSKASLFYIRDNTDLDQHLRVRVKPQNHNAEPTMDRFVGEADREMEVTGLTCCADVVDHNQYIQIGNSESRYPIFYDVKHDGPTEVLFLCAGKDHPFGPPFGPPFGLLLIPHGTEGRYKRIGWSWFAHRETEEWEEVFKLGRVRELTIV